MSATQHPDLSTPAAGGPALRRDILRLAWPVVAESLLGTLTQMVDMILVAPLGASAVAAVGLSTQPLWFLMGPFFGLAAGLGALVSRFTGAGDSDSARAAARQGFLLGGMLAALMGALIWWQSPEIIRLMGGAPDVVPAAAAYQRALAPGLVALFFSIVMNAVPRAAGDTRTPFYIGIGSNVINLGLAWALIYGMLGLPALGLVGAGVAASVARILGALTLVAILLGPRARVRLEAARLWQLDLSLLRRILNVGLPAAAERIATSLAYVVYSRMVASLGTLAVAAHYTAVVAENISWMVGMGLTTATATLVGQALGAGVPRRAYDAIREGVRVGLWAALPLTLLFGLLTVPYLTLFTRDAGVLSLATIALRVAAVGEAPMIVSLVFIGALTGAGDSRSVAAISLVGGWVVRLGIAALLVLGFGWGIGAAWAASVLDWTARVGMLYWRYRGKRWLSLRV